MPTIRGILQVAPTNPGGAARSAGRLKRGIPTVSAEEYSENNGFIGINNGTHRIHVWYIC